jgi:hypothetical protein
LYLGFLVAVTQTDVATERVRDMKRARIGGGTTGEWTFAVAMDVRCDPVLARVVSTRADVGTHRGKRPKTAVVARPVCARPGSSHGDVERVIATSSSAARELLWNLL